MPTSPNYADITGTQTDIAVGQILLDPENPRLASFDVKGQPEILRALVEQQSVDEVALSIAENGFYTTERLLVVAVEKGEADFSAKEKRYYVVEGNRRLAAVKILLDRKLQQTLHVSDLPAITAARRNELQKLPVAIFESRQRLWPYLGFRHVNGPRAWDAIDKAQFIARVHEVYKIPLDEVTRRIGDRFATVRKMYLGYRLLRQAETLGLFNREDRFGAKRFPFSHLYTAADQTPYQQFLGIAGTRIERANPVPRSHQRNLADLMLWIYGSASTDTPPRGRVSEPRSQPAARGCSECRRSRRAS